jgi:branched-chain amino acid transport system ATP-binding protein
VLLVEHDMGLVGRVADRVTVLDAGRVIASGTFAEIQREPSVRRAYLGEVLDTAAQEPATS